MNILPKKSWHVRTKRNIERVRRDEAKAAEEELAKEARRLLAEQEARTAFLRAKAQKSIPTTEKEGGGSSYQKHINFFDDVESAGKYFGTTNKEHEEEKKAEQEKFEKNIGLLTYLGQNEIESKGKTPWYLEPHAKRFKLDDDSDSNAPAINKAEKRKSLIDPLNDIRQYLDQKKKGKEPQKTTSASKPVVIHTEETLRSKHKHKHHKKHKKHKKNKRKDDDDVVVLKTTASKKSIEELRRERLAREREERKRAEELLKRHRGETTTESTEPPPPTDERCQRYNSQFNPHIARQNLL